MGFVGSDSSSTHQHRQEFINVGHEGVLSVPEKTRAPKPAPQSTSQPTCDVQVQHKEIPESFDVIDRYRQQFFDVVD